MVIRANTSDCFKYIYNSVFTFAELKCALVIGAEDLCSAFILILSKFTCVAYAYMQFQYNSLY